MVGQQEVALIQKLHDLTRAGKLTWETTVWPDVFEAPLQSGSVRIRNERNNIEIRIVNRDGLVAEVITVDDLTASEFQVDQGWFTLMSHLYDAARRTAHGAEKVVGDLLSELEGLR